MTSRTVQLVVAALVLGVGLWAAWGWISGDPDRDPAAAGSSGEAVPAIPFTGQAAEPVGGVPAGTFVRGSGAEYQGEPLVPEFESGPPDTPGAAAMAQRIHDNVLSMFDAALTPEFSDQIEVECTSDGTRCRFEGPANDQVSMRLTMARAEGRWDNGDLEGIEFEDPQWIRVDGEMRFSFVAKAP